MLSNALPNESLEFVMNRMFGPNWEYVVSVSPRDVVGNVCARGVRRRDVRRRAMLKTLRKLIWLQSESPSATNGQTRQAINGSYS